MAGGGRSLQQWAGPAPAAQAGKHPLHAAAAPGTSEDTHTGSVIAAAVAAAIKVVAGHLCWGLQERGQSSTQQHRTQHLHQPVRG